MISIIIKEINTYFSSLIAYMVIGIFLLFMGLMLWFFPDTSIIEGQYANLDSLFEISPLIFIFLIPAITMRSFAEEKSEGTIEFLQTKPISLLSIVIGKYLGAWILITLALAPTLLYYYSIYQLGYPVGNIDIGSTNGAYIGLVLLSGVFASIGLLASAFTTNQIVAFILAAFLCFFVFWGFDYISQLPVFYGKWDGLVQMIGIEYHYKSISRGVIDSRDVIYFLSISSFFVLLTHQVLQEKK